MGGVISVLRIFSKRPEQESYTFHLTMVKFLLCKNTSVKDVPQDEFVVAPSAFLKKSDKIKVPEWVDLVKTAKFKELSPYDQDWFYTRCASIARHLYLRSPVGVGAIRKIYGQNRRRGCAPNHFCIAAGGVARKSLQALAEAQIVENHPDGGRILSSNGRRVLDRIASQVRSKNEALVEEEEEVVEEVAGGACGGVGGISGVMVCHSHACN